LFSFFVLCCISLHLVDSPSADGPEDDAIV
jgi:hypothetical protein